MPVTGCPMLRVDVGKPRFRNVKLAGAVMVKSTTEIVSSAAGLTQSDLARYVEDQAAGQSPIRSHRIGAIEAAPCGQQAERAYPFRQIDCEAS